MANPEYQLQRAAYLPSFALAAAESALMTMLMSQRENRNKQNVILPAVQHATHQAAILVFLANLST